MPKSKDPATPPATADAGSGGGWLAAWLDLWQSVDAEARETLEAPWVVDGRTITVLVLAAVLLTVQHYVFIRGDWSLAVDTIRWTLGVDAALGFAAWCDAGNLRLAMLLWWALGAVLMYFVVPALVITFVFRQSLNDYGISPNQLWSGLWLYGLMFAVMAPLLAYFSQTPGFQAKYPFYHLAPGEPLWPRFWVWEVAYIVQFFALEFFFRGFLVHGTRHRFGFYSIFVMMVPYCMIHFEKPWQETCGAIIAGIVLGAMSLKTRSIWLGALLHCAVALSMDFLALWHKGYFSG